MRKKILFVFLLLVDFSSSYAQSMFAPVGSEWYHTMPCGVFYSHCTGDTIIDGITCRQVVRNAHTSSACLGMAGPVFDLPTLYFYNNSDTVFVYNHFFGRFTPLYIFNVHDGDIVTLPILPTDPGWFSFGCTDSTFSFVVDSVRMVLYDTAWLKTIYSRSLGLAEARYVGDKYTFSYGRMWDSLGVYAEKIGGISIGLLPQCLTCNYLIDEKIQSQDSLRCYNDSTLSVILAKTSCDVSNGNSMATTQLKKENLNIYPDPAKDLVFIDGLVTKVRFRLFNAVGIAVRDGAADAGSSISVKGLPPGVYLLELVDEVNGSRVVGRLVKQ